MGTEVSRRGFSSILLVFAIVLSMTLSITYVATPVLAGAVISYPVGTIDVVQGQTFTLRHRLAWDDPANPGYYLIAIYWDYFADNARHFTLDSVVAYFDNDGDNLPDPGVTLIDNTVQTRDNGTRFSLAVSNAVGDWRLGTFNVDITLRAAGLDGTPHSPTDNHPIYYTIVQSLEAFPPAIVVPAPVTVRVLVRSLVISPNYQGGPPGTRLKYIVTITNLGEDEDNFDLTVSDTENWGPTLDDYKFENIPPRENRQTTLSVVIPENVVLSTWDKITVTATSQTNAQISDNASCIAHATVIEEFMVIIEGKDTANNLNFYGPPPWVWYENNPPVLATSRAGFGAIVAGGTTSTCRDGRWNVGEWDVFLDIAFQWMVPGASNVLWYEGYNVYNDTFRCSSLIAALEGLGYSVTGDNTEPITPSLLSPYDILVISGFQLGYGWMGGDPSLLPDADVNAIVNFVEAGGGLLIMEGTDYFGYNFHRVQNKILQAFDFGLVFQHDSVYDYTNNQGAAWEPWFDVDTTNWIGSAYESETGKNEIGIYSVCSLSPPPPASFAPPHSDYGLDTDNDNLYNYLVVEANVSVDNAGWYEVHGGLWHYDGEWNWITSAWADNYLDVGTQTLELRFNGWHINSSGRNGPYYVDLNLYDDDWNYLDYYRHDTVFYAHDQFQPSPAKFAPPHSDYGLDTDNDDLYNYLVVEANVSVDNAGWYRLHGNLYDGEWNRITGAYADDYLDVGTRTLELKFEGLELYQSEIDGPYHVRLDLDDDDFNWLGYDEHETAAYTHDQFQSPPSPVAAYIKLTPPYEWTPRVSTTDVANGDDVGTWVNLPFEFPFWGEPKTRVWVCSNGFLIFDPSEGITWAYGNLEDLMERWMIAPFWYNLRTDVAGGIVNDPGIYVDNYADKVVITWEVTRYGYSDDSTKFQVVLYSNGDIRTNIDNATNFWNFFPTIGISRGDAFWYFNITYERGTNKSWLFSLERRGVDVSISPSYQIGLPEETLEYIVTVTNIGKDDDNFDLTVSDTENWGPTLDDCIFENILPGENRITTLRVTVPVDAIYGTKDNITVTVISQSDPNICDIGVVEAIAQMPLPIDYIVLIVIDGVRPDVLQAVDTPNFDALAAEGSYTWNAWTVTPSVTLAAIPSIMTGATPAVHQVTNWDGEIYAETIVEVFEEAGLPCAIVGQDPILGGYSATYCTDYYYHPEADENFTSTAIEWFIEYRPFFLTIYNPVPDGMGHEYGHESAEYREAIEDADYHVGRFVQTLKDLDVYDRTLIVITPDHGMTGTTHSRGYENDMRTFSIWRGPGVKQGYEMLDNVYIPPGANYDETYVAHRIIDIAPTITGLVGLGAPADAEGEVIHQIFAMPPGLLPHDPIYINGNDDFTPANGVVGGNGTENDPYIIEGWDISAENANGIEIRNTTAHFVIRNCYVYDGGENYNGIYLYLVENGKIENNIVENNEDSILLWGSKNNIISNNIVKYNLWGGIYFYYSDNNLIMNNVMENNFFGIDSWYSNNNVMTNNIVEKSYTGIRLVKSYNNLISNNIVKDNPHWRGIYLAGSDNNLVTNNLLENNGYGIRLSGNNNHIYHNNFMNNATQVYIEDGYNYWDDGYPSGGNYWSDYTGVDENRGENQDIPGSDGIGDTPYVMPPEYNLDRYPLINPWPPIMGVEVSISPSYRSGSPGTTLVYTVTVTNTGNVEDNFSLENIDNLGWHLELDNTWLIIPPGENRSTNLSVTIPLDAANCTEDNVTVIANLLHELTVKNRASCIAHAVGVPGAAEPIIIVGGKDTAYNTNLAGPAPLKEYTSSPPVMVAAKVGSGAVVAAGTVSTCRDMRWNDTSNPYPHLDDLLDASFQWMVPGARMVAWYEQFPESKRPSDLISALENKNYQVDYVSGPITDNLLAPYDIFVIPQLQFGLPGTGGNPNLLPDAYVQAIKRFVEGGKGLLIMESSDFGGHNYCKVQNKILKALGVGFYFQHDQVQDDTNNWDGAAYQPITVIDTTTEIGSAYQSETGTNEIGLYSICSLRIEVDYEVSVTVSPTINVGGAGEVLTYEVTVTNIGTKSDDYTLMVEDELGWPVSLSKNAASLEPGESEVVEAGVTVPTGLTEKLANLITFTASGVSEDDARVRAINVFPQENPPYPIVRPDVTRFLGSGLPTLLVDSPAVPVITAIETGFGVDLTAREPEPILYGEGEFAPVVAVELIGNGRVIAFPNSILRDAYYDRPELANDEVMSMIVRWMLDWADPRGSSLFYWVTEGSYHLPPGTSAPIVTKYVKDTLEEGLGIEVGTQVGGEITPGLIAGYDIIHLNEILEPLSSEEIQAVVDFVNDGGGLIIGSQADYGGFGRPRYPNEVLEALGSGIRFQDDELYDEDSWVVDGPWFPQVYLLDPREANPEFDVWFPEHNFTIYMPVKSMTLESAPAVFALLLTNVGTADSTYTIEVTEITTPASLGWDIEVKQTEIEVAAGENVEIYVVVTVPDIETGRKRMDLRIKVTDAVQDYLTRSDRFAVLGEDGRMPPEAKFEVGQRVSHVDWGEVTIEDVAWGGRDWAYIVETADGELKLAAEGELTEIPPGIEWDASITVTFTGGSDDALFGVRPDATDNFDSAYDIPEPPPPVAPPYVRTFFYYPEQTPDELHRSCLAPENLMGWPLRIEYADNIAKITLTWSVENVPTEYKVFLYRGEDLVVDMRLEENYTFEASTGSHNFRIVVGKIMPFTLELTQGWNMISFPILPVNSSPDSIFDGYYVLYRWDAGNKRYVLHADSGSFIEPDPNVEAGVGYWAYVLEDENVDLLGVPVNQLTLNLRQGWNLTGSPYSGSNIADPADYPDNSILPYAFTWNTKEKSYSMTQLLGAGKGYWTYALRDCTLELP